MNVLTEYARNIKIEAAKDQITTLLLERDDHTGDARDCITTQINSLWEEIDALEANARKIVGGTECRFHVRKDELSRDSLSFERKLMRKAREEARWKLKMTTV